jgi:hypothetical protein
LYSLSQRARSTSSKSILRKHKAWWLIAPGFVFFLVLIYTAVRISVGLLFLNAAYDSENQDSDLIDQVSSSCPNVRTAEIAFNDPLVKFAEISPAFGTELKAVTLAAQTASLFCEAGEAWIPIFEILGNPGETVPLASLEYARLATDSTLEEIREIYPELSNVDPAKLNFGLDRLFTTLTKAVRGVSEQGESIRSLAYFATVWIEQDQSVTGKKPWFVAFQNLAEVRGTGGMIGSYALIESTGLSASVIDAGPNEQLLNLGPVNYSSLPIDTRLTLGADQTDWRDLNALPHVPYSGRQIFDSWYSLNDQELAGVIFVGQGLVANLIALVGDVKVDDVVLSRENTVEFLSKEIYLRFDNPEQKDQFIIEVLGAVLSKLDSQTPDFRSFLESVLYPDSADRLAVWSSTPKLQSILEVGGVAGLVDSRDSSSIFLAFNNAAGNKLDAYTKIKTKLNWCEPLGQVSIEIELTNSVIQSALTDFVAPSIIGTQGKVLPKGSNKTQVLIYSPKNSELNEIFIDGQGGSAGFFEDRDREVLAILVDLAPNVTKNILINWNHDVSDSELTLPELHTSPHLKSIEILKTNCG